jgi:hypothetical protein
MTGVYILLIAILGILSFSAWKLTSRQTENVDPRMKAELEKKTEENGELRSKLEDATREKNELSGKGKQLYDNYKNLEADYKGTLKERDSLRDRVTKFETQQEQRQKKQEEMVAKLEAAEKALADERHRIRHEDEERLAQKEAERDRLWNDHENAVVARLSEITKKPQYAFTSYDNTNLPEGFHGNLKPDFLIEFLDQYVIFDAKVSKATNLQVYINDQVKSTAKKVKGKEKIYPTVFLVVPTDAIGELKKTSYYEEGFTFFVVSPEALEPILASLKRIENYEFAEAMDPQERENIVDLVAQFDFHISTRNAADLFLMQHGIETLAKTQATDPELAKEVAIKKAKMRVLNQKSSDQKAFVANPELVSDRLLELIQPKSQIAKEDIERLKN